MLEEIKEIIEKNRKLITMIKILWIILLIIQIIYLINNTTCICPLNSSHPLAILRMGDIKNAKEICSLYC